MAVNSGDSYGTYLRSDASASFRTIPDGTAFSSFPVDLLPLEVVSPEDQLRIFVNEVEVTFRDTKSLSPASTNYWTYSTDSGSLVVTLSDDITIESEDRITILRQTRANGPWVYPVPGSRARPDQFMVFYDQIMFIAQEMCELEEVSDLLGFFVNLTPNPFTSGNQSQLDVGGSSRDTVGYDEVELMPAFIGQIATGAWTGVDELQLIVETGDQEDGTSTVWTEVDAGNRTVDVDNQTVTITTGAVTVDIRVRRSTKRDEWWYDPRDSQPGWNTMGLVSVEKQARFLLEEICYLPEMEDLNPLSTRSFPVHRFFIYEGTQNIWRIPGWKGDGPVASIWKNDIFLEPDVDYTIDDFGIIIWIVAEPTTGDETLIRTEVDGWRGLIINFPVRTSDYTGLPATEPIGPQAPFFGEGVRYAAEIFGATWIAVCRDAGSVSFLTQGTGSELDFFQGDNALQIPLSFGNTYAVDPVPVLSTLFGFATQMYTSYSGGVCGGAVFQNLLDSIGLTIGDNPINLSLHCGLSQQGSATPAITFPEIHDYGAGGAAIAALPDPGEFIDFPATNPTPSVQTQGAGGGFLRLWRNPDPLV